MRIVLIVMLAMGLASCASREDIIQNYEEKVNYADGVNISEARLIAKRKIITTDEKRNYKITAPGVLANIYTEKYPNYWFVVFGHNWLSPISTDENAKTYTELKEAQYLVVIDKTTGDIPFSGEFFPKRSHDFDWIFRERRPWEERTTPPAGVPSPETTP